VALFICCLRSHINDYRLQLAAIPLLDPKIARQERIALQRHFKQKRDHILDRLDKLGLKVHVYPQATFYIWLNLETLPEPLNNGLVNFLSLMKKINTLLLDCPLDIL
jgi:aspartate/methionine/tyrosine aminotransferase